MTGAEAEVKCGEWDTASDLEEDYNVTLPIVKISVHPDFNISRGEQNSQFVVADIATIHVSDDNFEAQSRAHHINPACLPIQPLSDTAPAVHSGWSIPPPRDYLTAHVPAYLDVFQHFSKQWHNSMNLTKCEDPKIVQQLGGYDPYTLNHPTNSYYPPGTICAVEKEGEFCPTSGESGSPLMVKNDDGRMVAEGISSFIKVLKILLFSILLRVGGAMIKYLKKIFKTSYSAVLFLNSTKTAFMTFHSCVNDRIIPPCIRSCLAICPGSQLNTIWSTNTYILTLPVKLAMASSLRPLQRNVGQTLSIMSQTGKMAQKPPAFFHSLSTESFTLPASWTS